MAALKKSAALLKFAEVRGISFADLSQGIASAFRIHVNEAQTLSVPENAYDRQRGQYLSTGFLEILRKKRTATSETPSPVLLGLTEADLFVPRLNFVFGEADPVGGVAVVSVHRLRPEFYGEKPDLTLFRERVLKEAIHELGHVFGLGHCRNPFCIMRFSNSIADTDDKGPGFCRECQVKLAARGIGPAV